ncbi:Uncharacterized protein M6B38_242360 [Iris pallida]|uniref:Armadillo-like repeats domain-containing protein n=1 Tax=Iris pallida TaxID=29817 RepID=A0AAX6DJJ1_IRIPA|nr:Uncharacterized protein M6B38_242360 [Iris pallida]
MASSTLLRPLLAGPLITTNSPASPTNPFPLLKAHSRRRSKPFSSSSLFAAHANAKGWTSKEPKKEEEAKTDGFEEVEEDLPWIQEKAMDLVEFTGTVTQALPGPRVGRSPLPWILAVPIAYVGLSLVVAVVRTVKKLTSPKAKRKRMCYLLSWGILLQVNNNAFLLKSIDELLQKGRDELDNSALVGLMQKTGFSMEDILRKYIRYALNEKPFNPDTVVDLIHLRKASMLSDSQVAEVLNESSRRIVKEKGPVVMDISGFTERGFKRKLAVQALFGKILYLSELPEFCSRDSSLIIKEIFGVTDEDADTLRIQTLSGTGDFDSLEKMIDGPDFKELNDDSD